MTFYVTAWLWYGVATAMVILRFVARLLHFKDIRRLQTEDWVMLFIFFLYTIMIAFLTICYHTSTNLIDPADIPKLTPEDIQLRTYGSKCVLLVEQCMCAVQWGTKACLLLLYWRLTENLTQGYVVKAAAAYVGVTYVVMEVLYFAVWCRPFSDYWETPSDNVQCTTALHHLIVNLVFNLTSDVLIMSVPLPLLVRAHLEIKRKILLVFPFSLGFFTIICAILSKNLSFTQPFSAEWVYWYTREASTAMIVSNMPYSWAILRRVFHLNSFFGQTASTGMEHGGQPGQLRAMSVPSIFRNGSSPDQTWSGSRLSEAGLFDRNRRSVSNSLGKSELGKKESMPPGNGTPESREAWTSFDKRKADPRVDVDPLSSSSSTSDSCDRPPLPALYVPKKAERDVDKLYRIDDEALEADLTFVRAGRGYEPEMS